MTQIKKSFGTKVSYFWGDIEWWPWSWPWSRFSRLFQGQLHFFK